MKGGFTRTGGKNGLLRERRHASFTNSREFSTAHNLIAAYVYLARTIETNHLDFGLQCMLGRLFIADWRFAGHRSSLGTIHLELISWW